MASKGCSSLCLIALLCLGYFTAASEGFSCSVTDMNIYIGPDILPLSIEEPPSSEHKVINDAQQELDDGGHEPHEARHDELGAVGNKGSRETEGSMLLTIRPQKNGQRNKNYPSEGSFVINAQHMAVVNCYKGNTIGDFEQVASKLQEYFGLDHTVTPLGVDYESGDKKDKIRSNGTADVVTMATDSFKFGINWNISDFKMEAIDVRTIIQKYGMSSVPFYLRIFEDEELMDLDVKFAYIRQALKFKEGCTKDNIQISYNTTRWHFSLHAPFVSDNFDYRIALIGNHGDTCIKSLNKRNKVLNIYCENSAEKGIFMNKNIQLLFYTFRNYVPNRLFRIIIGYSDIFNHSPRANKILNWLCPQFESMLLLYAVFIFLLQILPFKNLENKSLRNWVSALSLVAYVALYCPCILLVTDVHETVALVYMFYLDTVTWNFGVYWLLCIFWILYPGVMCLLGLLPAAFFVSDIEVYGHFHLFMRREKCPETCPNAQTSDINNEKENYIIVDKSCDKIPLENKPIGIPTFTKIPLEMEKSSLIVNVPSYPKEKMSDIENSQPAQKLRKGSRVNLWAILYDVLGFIHGTIYLFSIQCFYFIVTGLFPLYNYLIVVIIFAAIELRIYMIRKY